MPTTTELTQTYISEHRSVKDCLGKGVINYSALSRVIAKELDIEKKTSKEAILIAARRFREKIKESPMEDRIVELFKKSNIEIKNNIVIYTLDKGSYPEALLEIEGAIKKGRDLFFSIEGSKTITVIVQEKNAEQVERRFKNTIMRKHAGLSLITISSPGIESTPGAVYHLSGLFFESGINIEEFMSCHDDTLIVIESKSVPQAMQFLKF